MPSRSNTDDLTAADWRPLVANGIATAKKEGRKTVYSLVYSALDSLLASALMENAEVDSVEAFRSDAITMETLVYEVVGLPNISRSCPPGRDETDWIDPFVGMTTVLKSRLSTSYKGGVQKLVKLSHKILVSKEKTVESTTPAGLVVRNKFMSYAVTATPEVVDVYLANPATVQTIKQDANKIAHNSALIDAVPAAAAVLIAALTVQATSAATRRDATYQHAIAELDSKDRAALDAEIAEAVQQSEISNGPELLALAGGSTETPEGEQG